MNPRSLTSHAESGSPHPHNAPSSTGPGGAASSPCASAPPAGQRLHGNHTQTTYPGRLLRSQVPAGQSRGAGRGMSWAWAQARGLLARPEAPVISAGGSHSCGASFLFQFSPRQRSGEGEGGAGRGQTRRVACGSGEEWPGGPLRES